MESWSQSSWLLSCATHQVVVFHLTYLIYTYLPYLTYVSIPFQRTKLLQMMSMWGSRGCFPWCSSSMVSRWLLRRATSSTNLRLGHPSQVLFSTYISEYCEAIGWGKFLVIQELLKTAGSQSATQPIRINETQVLESKISFSKAETSQLYIAAGLGGVRFIIFLSNPHMRCILDLCVVFISWICSGRSC